VKDKKRVLPRLIKFLCLLADKNDKYNVI